MTSAPRYSYPSAESSLDRQRYSRDQDRLDARRTLSAHLRRDESFRLDRRDRYLVEAPRIDRRRFDLDLYPEVRSSYDRSYSDRRDEDRRRPAVRTDPRSGIYPSVSHLRQREDYDPGYRDSPLIAPCRQPLPAHDPYRPRSPSYEHPSQRQRGRHGREPHHSRNGTSSQRSASVRTDSYASFSSSTSEQKYQPHSQRPPRAGLSYWEAHREAVSALDAFEDSIEPGCDEMEIEGADTGVTLPFKEKEPTPERLFAESRYLPLCRAIKCCLVGTYYAAASEVEERLLRDDAQVFHKLDLNSFRQYVFEAKRNGAPINYTQNVDDQITRLYFCLTRRMIDNASKADTTEGTIAGPILEARYLPLYQAMRKCITDEGYSSGAKVEDMLFKDDPLIYCKLGVDSLREYVNQARINKAPIDCPSDQDYVEKIWFCPTENMLVETMPCREGSTASNATGTTIGGDNEVLPEPEFFVMEEDEEDTKTQQDEALPIREPSPPVWRRQETPEPQDSTTPHELGVTSADEDKHKNEVKTDEKITTPIAEEKKVVKTEVKYDEEPKVKIEPITEVKTEGIGEDKSAIDMKVKTEDPLEALMPSEAEVLAQPIPEQRQKAYQLAHYLMLHFKDCPEPHIINAAAVAGMMRWSVEEVEAMVDECNLLQHSITLTWRIAASAQKALIRSRKFPRDEVSLRWAFTR